MPLTFRASVVRRCSCAGFFASAHLGIAVLAIVTVALLFATYHSATAGETTDRVKGIAVVIDGDSMRVAGEEVRLYGIDAPEFDQTCTHKDGLTWLCGEAAKGFLKDLIDRHQVECVVMQKGNQGRLIGMCNANGVALGASSVAHGMAIADRETSKSYVDLEKQARQLGAGIWSGVFEDPKAYRTRMKAGR